MKKILVIITAICVVFALASCGGDAKEASNTIQQAPQTASAESEATEASIEASTKSVVETATTPKTKSSTESKAKSEPQPLVQSGLWWAIDRFSGETANDVSLYIVESSDTYVVFHYHNAQGEFKGIRASVKSGYASVDIGNGITLNMTFKGTEIDVDEIQNMGAMAYTFKQ